MPKPVIELTVNNHPGVMAHITGMFARRAFNIEGILCGPIGNGDRSRIFLLVHEDARLEQLEKQLMKLYDVIEVRERDDYDRSLFTRLHEFVEEGAAAGGRVRRGVDVVDTAGVLATAQGIRGCRQSRR